MEEGELNKSDLDTVAEKIVEKLDNNEDDQVEEEHGHSSKKSIKSVFEADVNRETWRNKSEYILSLIGLIIGFGNIWRFPYLVHKNGGVAFLIPCVIFLFCAGIPVFFIELSVGQRMQRGVIGSWNSISPYMSGIGISALCISILVTLYYNTLFAWCISYFVWSWSFPKLPWAECIEQTSEKEFVIYNSIGTNGTVQVKNMSSPNLECELAGPAQYFWYRQTIDVSTDITDYGSWNWWIALWLVVSWIAVYVCLAEGTKTSGKVTYFTSIFPFVVLFIFFIGGFFLEDSVEGFLIFIAPQWDKLIEGKVWLDAGTQIFFALDLGFGTSITLSSFNPIHNNCSKDAFIVPIISFLTSVFAAIVMFIILGFKGMKEYHECIEHRNTSLYSLIDFNSIFGPEYLTKNWTIEHLNFPQDHFISLLNVTLAHPNGSKLILNSWGSTDNEDDLIYSHFCDKNQIVRKTGSGTGLVFITFAEAVVNFPPSQLWSIIFFLMMLTVGIDSAFGQLQAIVCCLEDLKIIKCRRWLIFIVVNVFFMLVTVCMFSPGNGIYILLFLDELCTGWPLMIIAFFECIGVAWVYGLEKYSYEVKLMTGHRIVPLAPPIFRYKAICSCGNQIAWSFYFVLGAIIIILVFSLVFQIIEGVSYPVWRKDLGMTEEKDWAVGFVLFSILLDLIVVMWIPLFAILAYFGIRVLKEDTELFPEDDLKEMRSYDEAEDKKTIGPIQTAILAKSIKGLLTLSRSVKDKEISKNPQEEMDGNDGSNLNKADLSTSLIHLDDGQVKVESESKDDTSSTVKPLDNDEGKASIIIKKHDKKDKNVKIKAKDKGKGGVFGKKK